MGVWLESHAALWSHPKTMRAARALGVAVPTLVGHMHALWHWALDHAEDGDLTPYDALDIAEAARWPGEPEAFLEALVACGPTGRAGFLERGGGCGEPGEARTGELVIHDWWDYAGKLVAKRRRDRERKRPTATSTGIPVEVHDASDGGRGVHDTTEQEQNHKNVSPPDGGRVDGEIDAADPSAQARIDEDRDRFDQHFWPVYPPRDGKKVGKGKALLAWRKLSIDQQRRAVRGAINLAASGQIPRDPERFLRRDKAGEFPFDDWQTPAAAGVDANAGGRPGDTAVM